METKEDGLGNTTCGRPLPSESEDQWTAPEKNADLRWPTTVKRSSETHGAEDVAVTAQGPWVWDFHISIILLQTQSNSGSKSVTVTFFVFFVISLTLYSIINLKLTFTHFYFNMKSK